jgi:predicted DNA-binding protein (MmcQ/YjbR family)
VSERNKAASARIRGLAAAIRGQVADLPGVMESARSFRVRGKILVRFSLRADHVFLECKLPPQEAARATKLPFVKPMLFGGMGKHGWVEMSVTRKSDLPTALRLIRSSHGLHR